MLGDNEEDNSEFISLNNKWMLDRQVGEEATEYEDSG